MTRGRIKFKKINTKQIKSTKISSIVKMKKMQKLYTKKRVYKKAYLCTQGK